MSSCLLARGLRAAVGPRIASARKEGRGGTGPVYFILSGKRKPSQKTPFIALLTWSPLASMETKGSGYSSGKLADLIKIGVPFTGKTGRVGSR